MSGCPTVYRKNTKSDFPPPNQSFQKKPAPAAESAINPLRLVVSGVVSGLSEDKLKQLFPKCYEAQVGRILGI